MEKMDYAERVKHSLGNLTGNDFEMAENEERANGNMIPDISFSKSFHARLAARALSISVSEVRDLPLREYMAVTIQVSSFLFGSLAEIVKVPPVSAEK